MIVMIYFRKTANSATEQSGKLHPVMFNNDQVYVYTAATMVCL